MCIWILCRCWEWACGNCETQRVAWRVIEVIAIYFGIYFEMEAGNKSRVLRMAIFEKCLCMPSLGMMACEFSCRNMVDIWILPRLKYPALRVPPAETRLTVYRRFEICPLHREIMNFGSRHPPILSVNWNFLQSELITWFLDSRECW